MENQHKNIANASANEIEMIACFVKQASRWNQLEGRMY
jgi:hypothetical protein